MRLFTFLQEIRFVCVLIDLGFFLEQWFLILYLLNEAVPFKHVTPSSFLNSIIVWIISFGVDTKLCCLFPCMVFLCLFFAGSFPCDFYHRGKINLSPMECP